MDGGAGGRETVPVEEGDHALRAEAADLPAEGEQALEEEARPEIRVDESVVEPPYGGEDAPVGESLGAAHGSHGSQGGAATAERLAPPSGQAATGANDSRREWWTRNGTRSS